MNESDFGHGVIRRNPIIKAIDRIYHYLDNTRLGKASAPFDFLTGYDVRDTIGPIVIKNQGLNEGCSGYAGSYFLEIQRKLKGVKEGDISAKSIYSPIAYPQGGTTVNALETQIGAHGANLEATVASVDVNGNPLPEYYMKSKAWETSLLLTDALTRAGYLPYDVSIDINTVANTLKQYGAVIIEVQGQNNSTWVSPMPKPPIGSQGLWQHFMCCVGVTTNQGKRCIIALNSWGSSVGINGSQYISEDYFASGHILNVSAFIPDAQLTPVPTANLTVYQQIWQNIVRWFNGQPAHA